MTHHRKFRLNEQFKREISQILAQKVRDPRIGRILVTEARVTTDLWLARIFFRSLDKDADADETLRGLDAAAPFIRRELGKILSIRRIPELRFLHDTTLDSALRIEEVLKQVIPVGAVEAEEPEAGSEEMEAGSEEMEAGSEEPEAGSEDGEGDSMSGEGED